jgi:pentatricopeptide repeat protein
MLDKALEVYEEALNLGIVLDLPAYDGILSALVEEGKIDDAIDILKEISAAKEVSPTERSYMPLLVALINRHDFLDATKLMDHGRSKNVAFSFQVRMHKKYLLLYE